MKAFPPVQFFSHGSCFLARKPAGENKYVATCTGTSGGKNKEKKGHLAYLPSKMGYCLRFKYTNTYFINFVY